MAGSADDTTSSEGNKVPDTKPAPSILSHNGIILKMDSLQNVKDHPNGFVPCRELETFVIAEKEDVADSDSNISENRLKSPCYSWCVLLILTFANILNYMDRYTIGGVLNDIIKYYKISNGTAGLLQTSFICSYMILSPIFGYMGDRYNRKLIMAVGIAFWSFVTLAGSFISADKFWAFILLRGLVGVGEASYSTIAPTIIADLFIKDQRSIALAVFYFAIPVGSGMGYIVGSNVAYALGAWQWSLRVTPPLGLLCVLLIILVVKEPPRGAMEGGSHMGTTSWLDDIVYLGKNKSFIYSTLGFTCVAFVAGSLALWAPLFQQYAILVQQGFQEEKTVSLVFGVITVIAGFLGVALGSQTARVLRRVYKNADPLVCGIGLVIAGPFFYMAITVSKYETTVTWLLVFVGEVFLCLNWAIVTDMLLYIVIPTRRSTAEAFQILLSHAFGDAGSPYIVGQVSDILNHHYRDKGTSAAMYLSLKYSLYIPCFVCIIGAGFFFTTALYIKKDRAKADFVIKAGRAAEHEHMLKQGPDTDVVVTA